jgi:hypothetical protein
VALAVVAAGCSSSTGDGGGGDAEDFETQLGEAFTNNLAGFAESLERLLLAASGNPQQGVTLTPTETGATGSVGVDVNGDGSLETSVNGTLTYLNPSAGFAGGATLVINSITGGAPQDASGTATITPLGPATIAVTNGSFETHTDTRGNDLYLDDVNLTVDASGSAIHATGSASFEFNDLEGTLTFLNPSSGYAIQVSGPGFETFTIP